MFIKPGFLQAYDRVLIEYLLKVMERMKFSPTFCLWIKMLHRGAKTRFILKSLSAAICVSFSIRQGDPLSMILHIIYIETFLLYLEWNLVGLRIGHIPQTVEAYCNDFNVLTSVVSDLRIVDTAVEKIELISEAILSREKLCTIMGFGNWQGWQEWPLEHLRVE